jgi:hypothetical protein
VCAGGEIEKRRAWGKSTAGAGAMPTLYGMEAHQRQLVSADRPPAELGVAVGGVRWRCGGMSGRQHAAGSDDTEECGRAQEVIG